MAHGLRRCLSGCRGRQAIASRSRRHDHRRGRSGRRRVAYDGPWPELVLPAARAQADDLRAVRRRGNRSRPRVARRRRLRGSRAELGLSLLPAGFADSELHDRAPCMQLGCHRRGAVTLFLVVHAGDGAHRTGASASCISSDGGIGPAERGAGPGRLSRLAAGARRQRRAGAGAARHLRRALETACALQREGARARSRHRRGPCADCRSCSRHLAPAGFGDLGSAQRACFTSRTQGDCAGGGARSRAEDGRRGRAAGRSRAARGGARPDAIRAAASTRVLVARIFRPTRASPAAGDVDASLLMLPLVGYEDPQRLAYRARSTPVNHAASRHGDCRLSLPRRRWRAMAGRAAS